MKKARLSKYIQYLKTKYEPSLIEDKISHQSNLVLNNDKLGYAATEAIHFWNAFKKINPLIKPNSKVIELGSAPDTFRNIALNCFKWNCQFDGTAFGESSYDLLSQTYKNSNFYKVNFDPSIVCKNNYASEFPFDIYETYDIVICTEVIEHLYNPYPLLNEIFKLLKPGGMVYLSSNNSSYFEKIFYAIMGGTPFEQKLELMSVGHDIDNVKWRHVRYYSKKQMCDIMEDNNFQVESSGYFQAYSILKNGLKEFIKRSLNVCGMQYKSHFEIIARKPSHER